MRTLIIKHGACIADAGTGERADWPCRNGVHANVLRSKISGKIAYAGFQSSLGDTHDIIVRHDTCGTAEGQRQQRTAVPHHFRSALRHFGEGEGRNHHGAAEIVARRVRIASLQFVLVREGDAMNEEVELAPLRLQLVKCGIDAGNVFDVARQDNG